MYRCIGSARLLRQKGVRGLGVPRVVPRASEAGRKYTGVYGEWTVREEDVIEVWSYRICLSAISLSTIGLSTRLGGTDEAFCLLGIGALGVALQLIHIYVTPLKRMLQAFWGIGALGYAYVHFHDATAAGVSTLDWILGHPWPSTFLVGPIGAAITGICFKEGLCYGKPECFALTFLVPGLFLSHLFSLDAAAPWVGWALDLSVCALGAVFAGRKYTQRLEDDIGDGSVFAFQRMSVEEQLEAIRRLEEERS